MTETGNKKWWVLGAMGASLGLMVLDETIVGVALPTIRQDLDLSQTASHWVVNAYLLVFAALAAAMGKLGDIVGLRRFFMLGLAIFAVTSLAAGFAQNEAWIVTARALQGVGAAIILPGSMAMMMMVFPPAERGVAIGIYGSIGSCFMASGPLLGGLFTEFLTWRWIFWVNPLIVLVIAIVVLVVWRDPPRTPQTERFDSAGFVTLAAGLGMLVMGLMQGPEWGWGSPAILILIVAGAVSLIAFVVIELRHRAPLIEVDLFANRTLATANLLIFTGQFSKTSIYILGALYLQHVLNMGALEAGVAILWAAAPVIIMAVTVGKLTDKWGERRPALFGLVINIAAFVWIVFLADGSSFWWLMPGFLVMGIAVSFFFVPPMRAVANALPDEKQGQAGGIMLTGQLLGGTMGMTVLGIVLVMTGDFQIVFATTVGLNIVVAVLAWAWFVRERKPSP